jgi:hypothetical protein
MLKIGIDPLLPKQAFAEARGCAVRTIDRMVKLGLMPRGEAINGRAIGWRASLVNLTLDELKDLAEAQPDEGAPEQRARSEMMREVGAKGGRRKRGRPYVPLQAPSQTRWRCPTSPAPATSSPPATGARPSACSTTR